MVIATALGLGKASSIAIAIVLAFVFGYGLTMRPLLRVVGAKRAARLAFASDTVSIGTMEIVDNLFIVAVPGALAAGLTDSLFWWSLIVSLAIAFIVTVPVNRWLIAAAKATPSFTPTITEHPKPGRLRRASAWRSAWRLMAIIRSAPSSLAARMPISPTAPSPTTATVLPGPAAAEPDQQLVIYTAEPGSPSAKALLELDAWAADHAGAASSLVLPPAYPRRPVKPRADDSDPRTCALFPEGAVGGADLAQTVSLSQTRPAFRTGRPW
jgi:hypothetical protein